MKTKNRVHQNARTNAGVKQSAKSAAALSGKFPPFLKDLRCLALLSLMKSNKSGYGLTLDNIMAYLPNWGVEAMASRSQIENWLQTNATATDRWYECTDGYWKLTQWGTACAASYLNHGPTPLPAEEKAKQAAEKEARVLARQKQDELDYAVQQAHALLALYEKFLHQPDDGSEFVDHIKSGFIQLSSQTFNRLCAASEGAFVAEGGAE